MDFPGIDWDKNDARIEQYTPTSDSDVGVTTDPVAGLTIVLNNLNVVDAFSADFNSTLTATINEGVSVGDIITCGNELLGIVVNYTAVCELSFTDISNIIDKSRPTAMLRFDVITLQHRHGVESDIVSLFISKGCRCLGSMCIALYI